MYDDNDHMFFLLADASLKEVEVGWGLRRSSKRIGLGARGALH